MFRPTNYNTKHGTAIIKYLASKKNTYVTALQIMEHLRQEQVIISRPTIYRQLDKLVNTGRVRKLLLDNTAGVCFQYIDPENERRDCCHLKCEVCHGLFELNCGEVREIILHISEEHAFQVNSSKMVFYGTCKTCLKNKVLSTAAGKQFSDSPQEGHFL